LNGSLSISPDSTSARCVVGSPITSVVPGGTSAGNGASSGRPPTDRPPCAPADGDGGRQAVIAMELLAITTAKRVEGIGEDSAAPGN
jgi:hypothetical protein